MRAKILRAIPSLGCILAPAVVAVVLVRLYFGRGLVDFTPTWSDEIVYWREIYTFHHVGFSGGYYSINEQPASAAFSHFGAHGPAFAILFGPLTMIAGWGYSYAPMFNLGLLAAAMVGYFRMTRIGGWKLPLATALILLCWPVLLYIPSDMQETSHQALALVLAGVFHRLITGGGRVPAWLLGLGTAVLIVASLLRPTWSPLFLALVVLRERSLSRRRGLVITAATIPVIGLAFGAGMWLAAPYPNSLAHMIEVARQSPRAGATLFLHHFYDNILLIFQGTSLEQGLRLELLAMLFLAAGVVVHRVVRGRGTADELARSSLFHVINLGSVLLTLLAFYDMSWWRDFRVLAPHILLSLLVAVPGVTLSSPVRAAVRNAFVVVPLALSLIMVVPFATTFEKLHREHFASGARGSGLLAREITYRKDAGPWENTVLIDAANFTPDLLQLPAGIGVSFVHTPAAVARPLKSRYLLMTPQTLEQLGNPPGMQRLGATRTGVLYRRDQ
jgi:hypothetical protein